MTPDPNYGNPDHDHQKFDLDGTAAFFTFCVKDRRFEATDVCCEHEGAPMRVEDNESIVCCGSCARYVLWRAGKIPSAPFPWSE